MVTGLIADWNTWKQHPRGVSIPAPELADLYERAADYIETHGWATGMFCNDNGGVCLTGAIGVTLQPDVFTGGTLHPDALEAWRYAVNYLAAFVPGTSLATLVHDPWGRVVDWNNSTAKDKYEVIELLRHTAKELRNAD